MAEEQLKASVDAEGAKLIEGDVELTDEELAGVAGGGGSYGGGIQMT